MSLLQEALKRKEQDEAQRQPEAGSTEKAPVALPPDDASLPAGQREAEGKNTAIPQGPPPQSMPVLSPSQSAASQPAQQSLGEVGGEARAARSEASPRPELGTKASLTLPWRRKASLLWVVVAAIAILTCLMVAGGFVFFIYRLLPPAKTKISQEAYQIHKADTTAAGDTNIVVAQPVPAVRPETASNAEAITPKIAAQEMLVPKPQSEKDSIDIAARTQTVAVMQTAVQQQSAGDTERKPVSVKPGLFRAEPAPARAKAPKASSSVVKWPVLKLTGILRGSGPTESTAFINGKMINAGQTIDEVTILEVQPDGVLLKYGSEKRFLRVGATLY